MIAKAREENCYHNKIAEPELYEAVHAIWQCFNTEEMLQQSWHPPWCQKSKSLNQMVNVLPPNINIYWAACCYLIRLL